MTPVLVADEIVFYQGEADGFDECSGQVPVIDFRREDRDRSGARGEAVRLCQEDECHRGGGQGRKEDEGECVLPEPF